MSEFFDMVVEIIFRLAVFVSVVFAEIVLISEPEVLSLFKNYPDFLLIILIILLLLAGFVASVNQMIFDMIREIIFWIIGYVHYLVGWILRGYEKGLIVALCLMIKNPYSMREEIRGLHEECDFMRVTDMDEIHAAFNQTLIKDKFRSIFHFDLF